jgi:hypothetical protein
LRIEGAKGCLDGDSYANYSFFHGGTEKGDPKAAADE